MKDPFQIDLIKLKEIIGEGCEHPLYEFKACIKLHIPEDKDKEKEKRAEFIKDMLALANTSLLEQERAFLICGVSDDGNIVGLSKSYDSSIFENLIKNRVEPNITFLYKEQEIEKKKIGIFILLPKGNKIITVSKDFMSSGNKTLLKKGQTWIREGTSKVLIKDLSRLLELQERLTSKLAATFELIKIEQTLKKDIEIKGEFFRIEPLWADFSESYIVERDEVDGVINGMQKNKIQLIEGRPASGKSILLKHIGFKLAERKKVFFVDLKMYTASMYENAINSIIRMKENSVFIVDDLHIFPQESMNLILRFQNKKTGNLIIGTRKIPKSYIDLRLFENIKSMNLTAPKIHTKIIQLYLMKELNLEEGEIEEKRKRFNYYKQNLWILSWALLAYDYEKNVVKEEMIFEKIRDRIQIMNTREDNVMFTDEIILIIAFFYQYEIPVDRLFLEDFLELDKKTIDILIKENEINESNGLLHFHHLSLADLYFETFEHYRKEIGRRIWRRYPNLIEYELLRDYCLFEPKNLFDAFYIFTDYYRGEPEADCDLYLLLFQNQEIEKLLIRELNNQENIIRTFNYLNIIPEICVGIYHEDPTAFEELAERLGNKLDVEKISNNLDQIAELSTLRFIFILTGVFNRKLLERIVQNLGSLKIEARLNLEEKILNITDFIHIIILANPKLAFQIINNLDEGALISKLNEESSIKDISDLLYEFRIVHEEKAIRLFGKLDNTQITNKFEADKGYLDCWVSIFNFKLFNEELATRLLENLIEKVNIERNIGTIGELLFSISELTPFSQEIFEQNDEPTQADYLEAPARYLFWSAFAEVNGVEEFNEFLKRINYNQFEELLTKEEDIGEIISFLDGLHRIDKKRTLEIFSRLNQNRLKEIITKETNERKLRRLTNLLTDLSKN